MIYSEQAIDFLSLSDKRFEELCFDLLLRLGFKGLTWRQGGADNGRDIEGRFALANPLIDSYDEKWFFECKRYNGGVPVAEITSKIAWADAEKPDHLAIIVSSYVSNNTREWLDKISSQKAYAIHLIERKKLKLLLLAYSDIISDYFSDKYTKLLRDAQKNLLIYDLLPEPTTLYVLAANLDATKLTGSELAFLLCSVLFVDNDIQAWCEENNYFKMDNIFANLKRCSNTDIPLLEQIGEYTKGTWSNNNSRAIAVYGNSGSVMKYEHSFITPLLLNHHKEKTHALYLGKQLSDTEAVEILIEIQSDFPTKIRSFNIQDAKEWIHRTMLTLVEKDIGY